MTDYTWTEASAGDEAEILALMEAFYAEEHLEFSHDRMQSGYRELLAKPEWGKLFVLRQAGEKSSISGYTIVTIGFSIEFCGRFVLLDELYLSPAVRGRGLAQSALAHVKAWTLNQGVSTLRVEVNHHNGRAKGIYLKSGFVDDKREIMTTLLRSEVPSSK